ncbi:DUF599 domain-containing protein [Pelagovum pacificum]|uniref:DUF599 domain-containing protein n=1 Tax=Pelagovum pacificum TaxID=2588711 RepID=A0A5C5GJ10_9RHOB|nr:DUF599 domain-containing protein [Pelagovum pacificum]QQA43458.1 DUF599 domain-containing protein [Pelagovum pacificum]TNY33406.1 DUF599 domain-containing protein [Pelagovum pacificum]
MSWGEVLSLLSVWDLGALAFLFVSAMLIGWHIEHPPKRRVSVTKLMAQYRRDWLVAFAARDVRIFDSQILATLRQGTSFFASTCILAIGGVLALVGNTDPLTGIAEELTAEHRSQFFWQIKLLVVVLFLTAAFLRFVWANRVFGYCAVVMASVANLGEDHEVGEDAMDRARRAGELNIRAAVNFNRGLRAMYFALGSLAWILGPIPLIIATCVTLWVVWSREFASIPRDILMR